MPKVKTKKTVLKRFKITKTGKILRGHHLSRHRRFYKTKRRIRTFKEPKMLNPKQAKIIKRMLGI